MFKITVSAITYKCTRILVVLSLVLFSVSFAGKQEMFSKSLKRSLVITLGYAERAFNSNAMMRWGPLSLMQLSTKGFDALTHKFDSKVVNWSMGVLWFGPHAILSFLNNTVYHEFGHARASSSLGIPYAYTVLDDQDPQTEFAFGLYYQKLKHPKALFDGAKTISHGAIKFYDLPNTLRRKLIPSSVYYTLSKQLEVWVDKDEEVDETVLNRWEKMLLNNTRSHVSMPHSRYSDGHMAAEDIEGVFQKVQDQKERTRQESDIYKILQDELTIYRNIAGLNNQMQYANAIAEVIWKHQGHFLYSTDYILGKLSTFAYTWVYQSRKARNTLSEGDDIDNILRRYRNRGWKITDGDLQFSSILSLLCSATTWSFVNTMVNELHQGSFQVHAPVWKGWRLPETNMYLTTQGLSVEIATGYHWNERWYTGLGVESVVKGNRECEITPMLGYTLNTKSFGTFQFEASLSYNFVNAAGGGIKVDWTSVDERWQVGLAYTLHNVGTLIGERNIPFLQQGPMSFGKLSGINHELNIVFGYVY